MENPAEQFSQFLAQHRDATFLVDAGEALAELVSAVHQTGRAGTLTIKIAVRPATKTASAQIVVTDTIATKLPAAQPAETIMYALEGGGLSRRDPRQPALPLDREASGD